MEEHQKCIGIITEISNKHIQIKKVLYEDRDRYCLAIELCRDKDHKINFESNAEYMAELLAEREFASIKLWLSIYTK